MITILYSPYLKLFKQLFCIMYILDVFKVNGCFVETTPEAIMA